MLNEPQAENNEVQPTQPAADQQPAATEPANIATPGSDQPAPETITYADKDKSLFEFMAWEMAEQRRKDDKIRKAPDFRVAMVRLVEALHDLILEEAGKLAVKRRQSDPFEVDKISEHMLWGLNEYLGNVNIDRDSFEYEEMVRFHQLDVDHAGHVFDVWLSVDMGTKTMSYIASDSDYQETTYR